MSAMTPVAWIALVACAMTVLSLIGTAVWVVSTIKTTTEALRNEIHRLRKTIERIEARQWDQAEKLAALEAKLNR